MSCRHLHPFLALAILLSFACSPSVWAVNEGIVRAGAEAGGETVVEVANARGTSIRGGGLLHFELGFQRNLVPNRLNWETEATLGYKTDSRNHLGGTITFNRITLNIVQFYKATNKLRFGAGGTYHLNPTAEADFPDVLKFDKELDNSLGFIIAADYRLFRKVNVGVRATLIDYGVDGRTAESNSAGVYTSFMF